MEKEPIKPKNFLNEFNMFRAFTIITIVMAHMCICFGIGAEGEATVATNSIILRIIFCIISGNSALFVFISGFLFYYVFYQRGFQYDQFIIGKAKNVLCPYCVTVLIFTLLNIIYCVFSGKNIPWDSVTSFLSQTFWYHAFWYVPFIMLMFSFAGLHVMFIKQSRNRQIKWIGFFTLLAMITGRNNNDPLQSVLYYTALYLFGIICAINYDEILKITRKTWALIIIIWIISIFMAVHSNNYIDIYKTTVKHILPLSWVVPIKIISCLVFIHFFKCICCSRLNKIMSFIAKYSFSIYFFHVFIVKILYSFNIRGNLCIMTLYACCIATPIVISVCLLIAWALKKIIGKNSRMYIGS